MTVGRRAAEEDVQMAAVEASEGGSEEAERYSAAESEKLLR